MTEQRGERRTNPAAEFVKQYWFLIAFSLSAIGIVVTLWFEVQYVVRAVNPDTLIEYNREQAILSTKRDIRWCLGKLLIGPEKITQRQLLECAD